jgi:hypothetical protein
VVRKVKEVQQEYPGNKELKERRVIGEHRGIRGVKDRKDLLGRGVHRVPRETGVKPGPEALQGPLAQLVLEDVQDLRVQGTV